MTTSGREKLSAALARLCTDPTYAAHAAVSAALKGLSAAETGMQPVRVAVLRNFTVEALLPVIEGELARTGFHPVTYIGGFDTIARDALDPASALYAFQPDFVILAQWLDTLSPLLAARFMSLRPEAAEAEIERVLGAITEIIDALRRRSNAPVLLNNFPLPRYPTLGILDAQSDAYQSGALLKLNDRLRQCARQYRDVYLIDFMGLTARIGSEQAIDERYWHIGRAPIGRPALPAFAHEYAKFIRALQGRTRKCLVLDCDNTLWGGVVGEDGIEGIQLGTAYPGSCYQAFQREILNLHDRGVILALCSKNNENDVLDVLRHHPDMLLREEHFATWQINWNDKIVGLRKIAGRLNLGIDALVLADDSRFECDLVEQNLPQVAVLHLGDEPSAFRARLSREGYFDSLTFSTEDRERTRMYRDEAQRIQLHQSAGSIAEYLARLEMVATLGTADDMHIPRIAQLTQKTNQFNLTTRRYTEGEIRALSADPGADVFYLKLRDRVSELGLVGVAIVKYEASDAEIEGFLLSCRAIGRSAEDCLLAHCLNSARARGCARILGRYFPTNKNMQVAEFYSRRNFQALGGTGRADAWEFCFDRDSFIPPDWIAVELIELEDKYARQ